MTKKRKSKQAVINHQSIDTEDSLQSSKSKVPISDDTHKLDFNEETNQLPPKKKRKKNEAPVNGDIVNDEPILSNEVKPKKKKNKKAIEEIKPEIEEQPFAKSHKKKKVKHSDVSTESSQDSEHFEIKSKSKIKLDGESTNDSVQIVEGNSPENDNMPVGSKKSNKKNNAEASEAILWPQEDITELVNRMEQCVPADDHFSYKTRLLKLEWEQIAFKNYTIDDCQKTWAKLERNIRSYRLLREMLSDARTVVNNLKNGSMKTNKLLVHPDKPRRPLSAYLLYFIKKKSKVQKEHPGVDGVELTRLIGQMFKNLTPEKKAKYEEISAKNKAEYQVKLEEFYKNHPEVPRSNARLQKDKPEKPKKERVPKRPDIPFKQFFKSELSKQDIPETEIVNFRDVCREKWKNMTDKQKLPWINYAEEEYEKFEEKLKLYIESHPNFVHTDEKKRFLSKEEMQIKDRLAGKPDKPPVTPYAVYAKLILNKDELKDIPAKERMNFISNKWKLLSDKEKQDVKSLHTQMLNQYKKDFMRYVYTLPEDKRKEELQNFSFKKQLGDSEKNSKKQKATKKFEEPEQPPISPFKYFASLYTGEEPVAQVWKALSIEEKQKYEKELVQKKQEYILEFEKFLKSLTKDELEAFSNLRKQKIEMKQNPVEISTESDSDSEEEEEDDIEIGENDNENYID